MSRRIGIYSRQSNANDVQVEEHARWAVDRVGRQGDTVVGPFKDNGISGFKLKTRPEFERLVDAVASGEVDAIMAVTYDRLTRNAREEAYRLLDALDAAGVHDLLFLDEPDLDVSTATGRRDYMDRANAAQFYSARLGEKVRGSKARIARDGRWCGAAPYGYDIIPPPVGRRIGSSLVENTAEADVIREALAMVKAGDNLNRIAMKFRARGLTTGWGNTWTSKSLRRVLLSPAIAGLASLNGEVLRDVMVQWEPIITKADHEFLAERLAVGTVDRHPDGANLRHPLTGILRCGLCGTKMSGTVLRSGKARYACATERGGCGRVSVYNGVEHIAVTWALTALLVEGRKPVAEGVAADVHEAAAAELSAIAADRAKLNALADLFSADELKPKFADLKKRERAAKATLAKPVAVGQNPRQVAETIKARWDAYQAGDRDAAELLHDEVALLIDRIDVAPYKRGTRKNVFDPDRLTFVTKWLPPQVMKSITKART